jgi:acetyltransferase EpsM
VLVGGGEHAKVVLDAARSRPGAWSVVGFVDPKARDGLLDAGVPWLGGDDLTFRDTGKRSFVIAIGGFGDATARRRVASEYSAKEVAWATVTHARATVSPSAELGSGVVVLAAAVINPGARIGNHVIINTGAVVEHDVLVGEFAHIAPGAVIGGGTSVGAGTSIGLGARVRDHVRIGRDCVIGMGAVVLEDVADASVVVGIPARPIHTTGQRDG